MKRSPLKRRTPLKRGSRLRPVSKKREGWLREYREAKKNYPFPAICPVCGDRIDLSDHFDFHHPNTRKTKEDLLNFFPVHRGCHDLIHSNPNQARQNGWLN